MKTLMKWTVEEYHRLIDTGILHEHRVELLKGEIIQMSPEGPIHAYLTGGIADYLQTLLQGVALVREAHPITLADSEPQPDIAIVQLLRQRYQERHPYLEDIFGLIEISHSTLNYDLNEKKQVYARENIQEYWVIDINSHQVYVFLNPLSEDYRTESVFREGTITLRAFPLIEIAVNKLFQ